MARGTVRMLGTFLLDPRDVPHVAVDYVAEQIGVADPSCIKLYPERTQTKWDHQGEIRELLEYQEFVEVQAGLLMGSRVRHFRVSRRELFDRAVVWLIDNKVVLPGMAELAAYGMTAKAPKIKQLEAMRRSATLLATVRHPGVEHIREHDGLVSGS